MSFGFAIGDFIAVMNLTWKLHQDCYKVLQDCPQEIKDLSRDLATIYGVLRHIQDDLESIESSIKKHGEDRQILLQNMVTNLRSTLDSLQRLVLGFRDLASEGMGRQIRQKLTWLASQKKINRIHQDVVFHISSFNLILASMGNSSLRRIESGLQSIRLSSLQANKTTSETISEAFTLEPRNDSGSMPSDSKRLDFIEGYEVVAVQSSNSTAFDSTLYQGVGTKSPMNDQTPRINDVARRLQALTVPLQEEIANLTISHCQVACFEFYVANALWRTKFESKDKSSEPKVFDCQSGYSAKHPTDFSLLEWIAKIRHAWGLRCNEHDSCHYNAIADGKQFRETMKEAERIPSMLLPWGGLNIHYCESALECAIQFCKHLKSWNSEAHLSRLLTLIRRSLDNIDFNDLRPRTTNVLIPTIARTSMATHDSENAAQN